MIDLSTMTDKDLAKHRAKWFNIGESKFLISFQDLSNFKTTLSVHDIATIIMANIHEWSNVKINHEPFEFSHESLVIALRDANFLVQMSEIVFDPSKF